MARVKERATQQEVRLGQLEGELVRKDKLLVRSRRSSPATLLEPIVPGLRMPWPKLPMCILGGPFPSCLTKRIVDGQLVDAQE